MKLKREKNTENIKNNFIIKSKLKFNNKFSYEKIIYKNKRTDIIITCNIHGDFITTPEKHFKHLWGSCTQCKDDELKNDLLLQFISKSNLVHNNKYTYDKFIYIDAKNKSIVTCPEHGDFPVSSNNHMRGKGCPRCSLVKNTEDFIKKANKIHNNTYDYTNTIWKSAKELVEINCLKHGIFFVTPDAHLSIYNKTGCPDCSIQGFNKNKKAYFYIQEIYDNDILISYKFGITNNIKRRFRNQNCKSIYKHKLFYSFDNIGKIIYDLERYIKNNIDASFISKENMKDGFTETINPKDIDKLENLIIEYMTNELSNNN